MTRNAEWPTDFDGVPMPAGACDDVEIHELHVYWAVNREAYVCAGMKADDVAELERMASEPPCEHGLSAWLCEGPNHYPADRIY